jgi:hypothetical protein
MLDRPTDRTIHTPTLAIPSGGSGVQGQGDSNPYFECAVLIQEAVP